MWGMDRKHEPLCNEVQGIRDQEGSWFDRKDVWNGKERINTGFAIYLTFYFGNKSIQIF